MVLRRNLWDPSAIDGSGTEGGTAPDGGILFSDHNAFQFDATAPDAAAAADDWSGVAIDVDFVDDTFQFSDPATDSTVSLVHEAPGETQTSSLTQEELSALYPGIVWPPMSEWTSPATDGGDPRSAISSQADPEVAAVQNVGPAGLDWQVTPDFDDDPGWYPGWIPTSATAPRTDDGAAPTNSATTSSADEPPALRDETQTSSLTLAELNEQYPGIVWPANWWLL